MSSDRHKFWVTCPSCSEKFGVNASTVFKYVNRIVADLQDGTGKQTKRGRSATKKGKS